MCICIPNMKFLRLTLCQGEVYTDAGADVNDDGQFMIVQGSLVINQMSQKSSGLTKQVYFGRDKDM